jgi:hypothetical protein
VAATWALEILMSPNEPIRPNENDFSGSPHDSSGSHEHVSQREVGILFFVTISALHGSMSPNELLLSEVAEHSSQ